MTTQKKIHEVVAIIDRSGSMNGKEEDTIGGINSTFEVLKEDPDENVTTKVSIKLFDNEEIMLVKSIDLMDVKPIERHQYRPRGSTALLDAIGNTLKYFIDKKEEEGGAYDVCTIYVVTDGLENSSQKYNDNDIKKMINNASEYNIEILYLGANQDAIFEASKCGIASKNSLNYFESCGNVRSAYRSAATASKRHVSGYDPGFLQVERNASQSYVENSGENSVVEPPPIRRCRRVSRSSSSN